MAYDSEPNFDLDYRRIEVIADRGGWIIAEEGQQAGRCLSEEAAYKKALALCAALFDKGVRSRVTQVYD